MRTLNHSNLIGISDVPVGQSPEAGFITHKRMATVPKVVFFLGSECQASTKGYRVPTV